VLGYWAGAISARAISPGYLRVRDGECVRDSCISPPLGQVSSSLLGGDLSEVLGWIDEAVGFEPLPFPCSRFLLQAGALFLSRLVLCFASGYTLAISDLLQAGAPGY